ncbi:hypothetical protein [Mycobacteroides abscessus]
MMMTEVRDLAVAVTDNSDVHMDVVSNEFGWHVTLRSNGPVHGVDIDGEEIEAYPGDVITTHSAADLEEVLSATHTRLLELQAAKHGNRAATPDATVGGTS